MSEHSRMRGTSREIVETARELRRRQTAAEQKLWQVLRNRQATGYRVRRQHPYGRYVIDFWIAPLRIAIEVDGGIHDDPGIAAQDDDRAIWLRGDDIRLLRFRNEEIFTDRDGVIAQINRCIAEREREKKPIENFRKD